MATSQEKLDAMLDKLENDLPKLILEYPDADGADFWIAFARRSNVIAVAARSADVQHVRHRLDRMLDTRGLLASENKVEPCQ
jgi:hypothetical protein